MDLRVMRYFVAVAEEGHFTRAAARLGIKQPPLSIAMRKLEEEMGTLLLNRLTRGVEVTEAGALLLDRARTIIDQVEHTMMDVANRARGETGTIRLGFAGGTYAQQLVPKLILAFRNRYPQMQLLPIQSNTPQLLDLVRADAIDIAFVRPPLAGQSGISVSSFVDEAMLIVLPATHHLAKAEALPLSALAQEDIILFPRAIGPGLYDSIIAACQQAGFSPTLGQEAPQLPSIVYMVAAGFGASILPASICQIHADGIVYVKIEGASPMAPIGLAYKSNTRQVGVRNFLKLALSLRPKQASGSSDSNGAEARTDVNELARPI